MAHVAPQYPVDTLLHFLEGVLRCGVGVLGLGPFEDGVHHLRRGQMALLDRLVEQSLDPRLLRALRGIRTVAVLSQGREVERLARARCRYGRGGRRSGLRCRKEVARGQAQGVPFGTEGGVLGLKGLSLGDPFGVDGLFLFGHADLDRIPDRGEAVPPQPEQELGPLGAQLLDRPPRGFVKGGDDGDLRDVLGDVKRQGGHGATRSRSSSNTAVVDVPWPSWAGPGSSSGIPWR